MNHFGALRAVLQRITHLYQQQVPFVLALVVSTEGSTYRKAGALLVTDASGQATGHLSGGCLESEWIDAALSTLAHDQPALKIIDSRGDDDVLFGSGSGCRGMSKILLLPMQPQRDAAFIHALLALQTAHGPMSLHLCDHHSQLGLLWGEVDGIEFRYGNASLGDEALRTLLIAPPPQLLLLGAGPEIAPLIRFAHAIGWRVSVADHRRALLDTVASHADDTLCAHPAIALAEFQSRRLDAVVVMTHHATHDLNALRTLATKTAQHAKLHIALLGPPSRRDELLQQLTEHECAALQPRLQAPAGLSLGGEGPEAIALSIVAGLPVIRSSVS